MNDINENESKSLYFWDISRQKYVMLMTDTQEIKVVEKEHIKRHYYINNPSQWKNIKDTLFLTDEHIKNRYLTFEPLKPYEWEENGFIYRNTYIESNISKRAKAEREKGLLSINDSQVFLEKYPHIKALLENLCNQSEYLEYFINWLSYIFATKEKSGVAVLFRGIQGTGKGVLWKYIIEYFFGTNYVQVLENDSLKSNFTPKGLEKSLFALANEIKGDFRDGNSMYEKLKMYISDDTLRIEEKGIQSFNAKNHFNMIFFSNNDVPLQIQGSDRRYSIFQTRARTLIEVAKNDFEMSIDDFIKSIVKERDKFLIDLVCYAYDMSKAKSCLETEEKERIYRASMTKIEILADKVKSLDIGFFENDICEILELMSSEEKKELYSKYNIISFVNNNDKEDDLLTVRNIVNEMRKFAFNHKCLPNSTLNFLYLVFVDKSANQTKIGTALNSHFGQSFTKSIENKKLRIREVAEFQQKEFLDKLMPF
jgi:hypothetical protein